MDNEASAFQSHQRMDYVQTDSGANQNALLQSLSEH